MQTNIFIYMITNTSTSTINNKCIFYSALPQHCAILIKYLNNINNWTYKTSDQNN